MAFTKQQKRILSSIYAQKPATLPVPLWDVPRRIYEDDGSYIEYGFYQGMEHMSDIEVAGFFHECVTIRIPAWMEWDCTGCEFTRSLNWHRNPNGDVSFIHRVGIDI